MSESLEEREKENGESCYYEGGANSLLNDIIIDLMSNDFNIAQPAKT